MWDPGPAPSSLGLLCAYYTHGRCSPGHLSLCSLAHVSFLTCLPAFKQSPPAIPALGTNVKKRRHGDEDMFYMHVSGLGGQACVFPSPKIPDWGSTDVTRDGRGWHTDT